MGRIREIRKPHPFIFMDISLEFGDDDLESRITDERQLKLLLMSAVKSLHGDHGSATTMDVLKMAGEPECRAYLRVSTSHFVMVRSALTMLSSWEGRECGIRIHKVCHSLSSLPIRSANMQHQEIDLPIRV